MRSFGWFFVICSVLLAGCSPMEHRSDLPEKQQLTSIEKPIVITRKWGNDAGSGVGKEDYKLVATRSGKNLYTVDYKGVVSAFDMNSGTELWRSSLKAPVSAGPAVGEGKIVVGTSNGKIIATDLAGKRSWTSTTTSEVLAAPQITEGVVMVHTMDGGLSAFSVLDGRQLWRFSHNLPPLMLRRSSTPIVSDNLVIVGFANGKLLALRKQDGAVEWSHDVAKPKGRTDLQRMVDISADPVVYNGVIYAVGYQGNLVALQRSNGQLLWERDLGSYSGLTVDHGIAYVSGTQGDLYAIDTTSGDTYWVQSDLIGRRLSQPAVMGKYVVLADEDGVVHWVDKHTGIRVGRYSVDRSGVEAAPIVNNNVVYILGRSGKLVALEVN